MLRPRGRPRKNCDWNGREWVPRHSEAPAPTIFRPSRGRDTVVIRIAPPPPPRHVTERETPPAPPPEPVVAPEPTADALRRWKAAQVTESERERALSAYHQTNAPYVYYFDGNNTVQRLFHEVAPRPPRVPPARVRKVWRTVLVRGPDASLLLEAGEEEYIERWVLEAY